jgi:hypothetical protein
MPQLVSSLALGLSFVIEKHADNEIGAFRSEGRVFHPSWRMRAALAAAIVVATVLLMGPAKADPRWCAISNQVVGDCSFATIEQCHAAVSGTGGFCMWEAPVGHRQPTRASIEAARKETP